MKADVLQSAKHALESLDTDRLVSLYADDLVFEDTASNEVITSKEELRNYFHHLFALPNVKFSNVSSSTVKTEGLASGLGRARNLARTLSIQ